MNFKTKILTWLLRNHPEIYVRQKGVEDLDLSSEPEFLEIHRELLVDRRSIQTLEERYTIYSLVKNTAKLPGVIAEAGVFQGGSAKVICRVKGDTPLYLFDTFEGLPAVDKSADGNFSTGDFHETGLEQVKSYLHGFPQVHFYPGFFPASAVGQEPAKLTYRLVHLDLDLRQSTFDALTFFYPRLVRGGILISHDYRRLSAPGVKTAFDEFFRDKPVVVLRLPGSHAAVVNAGE